MSETYRLGAQSRRSPSKMEVATEKVARALVDKLRLRLLLIHPFISAPSRPEWGRSATNLPTFRNCSHYMRSM
ncbi:hypothetical protein J6590_070063 [Homalodisca vitripennis]|nr:hypothetical protein J6590_070063 [Homalodisca vitripennis]